MRGNIYREVQWIIVIIEDKLLSINGKSSVILKEVYCQVFSVQLSQFQVNTRGAHTGYPGKQSEYVHRALMDSF